MKSIENKFDFPDRLWTIVEPFLPKRKIDPKKGGRPRLEDRLALSGILYRLGTGIQWRYFSPIFGTKSSVHRRFQWVETGNSYACLCISLWKIPRMGGGRAF